MSVRSAQSVTVLFTTRVFATGIGTNADSLPTGVLYLNGVANAATVTVANLATGKYTAQVTLPTLAVNDEVELMITATVSGVTDSGVIWGDTKDVFAGAIPDVVAGGVGGMPLAVDASGRVDVLKINGTSQTARDIGASVLLSPGTGTGQISITAGAITVGTNNDKTGYSLTQAFPSNFSALLIGATGHITNVDTTTTATNLTNAATAGDFTAAMKTSLNAATPTITLPAIPNNWITAAGINAGALNGKGDWLLSSSVIIRSNTAQASGASTITLDAGASAVDNFYNDCIVHAGGQYRPVQSYVGATKVATIFPGWATQPGAVAYELLMGTQVDLGCWVNVIPTALSGGAVSAAVTSMGASVITAGSIAAGALNGKGDWALSTADFNATQKTSLNAATPALAANGFDAILIETGIVAGPNLTNDAAAQLTSINARQAIAIICAANAGVVAGAAGADITFKPAGLPAGNTRIESSAADANGNRPTIVLKVPT
jgi:hypothetical protein